MHIGTNEPFWGFQSRPCMTCPDRKKLATQKGHTIYIFTRLG